MAKNVTLKNTKQEIYDVINASLEREKELRFLVMQIMIQESNFL